MTKTKLCLLILITFVLIVPVYSHAQYNGPMWTDDGNPYGVDDLQFMEDIKRQQLLELQRIEILRQQSTPKNAGIQNMINTTACDKYWSWCRNRVK